MPVSKLRKKESILAYDRVHLGTAIEYIVSASFLGVVLNVHVVE